MSYGVVAHLDPATEERVRETMDALRDAGLTNPDAAQLYRPHVTLAFSDHIEQGGLSDAMARFAASTASVRLTLSSIGLFPTAEGVLYYGVTVTKALLDLHGSVDRVYKPFARRLIGYYSVGAWVPHVTLALHLASDRLWAAIEIAMRTQFPLFGSVHELALVRVQLNGRVELLERWRLRTDN